MNRLTKSVRRQRVLVLIALVGLCAASFLWPGTAPSGDRAQAAALGCPTSATPLDGLVNGNSLALGNGTTVTPCIPNAPLHLRIGYRDGDSGEPTGEILPSAFTTDGITFPDGQFTIPGTGCGLGRAETIAKPTILQFADGSRSAGPADRTTYPDGGVVSCGGTPSSLYADQGWPTTFAQSDEAMLVHMRLKNLKINRDAFITVVPQEDPAAPTAAGTGEYKLTFTPEDQGSADWNIGDSCVYTDLWLRADTFIRVNILGIPTSVSQLAGGSLVGDLLGLVASLPGIPGLQLDAWVYYMSTNKSSDCTGSPTTLNLPSTNIGVTP